MKRNIRNKAVLILTVLCFAVQWSGCGRLEQYYEIISEIKNEEADLDNRKAKEKEIVPKVLEFEEESEEELQTEEMPVTVPEENYAYSTLDDETRKVYDEVLNTILEQEEEVELSTTDTGVLENAYKAVCADYGGLFWVSGYAYTQYTRGGKIVGMDLTPKYTMDYEERIATQQQIDGSVEELLAGISITDSDYAKAKYVFEILIQNVDYDASTDNNQNIISVFLNRATVCQGYACATQYLLNLLGIRSTIVTGKANGEAHAWNLVCLDGDYYYMDTTWGNSRYLDDESQVGKYVNYSYLAVTSEEMSRTHMLDNSFPLPECTNMTDNYFVQEGKYFNEWNPDAVGVLFQQTWEESGSGNSVKFSSADLYEQAVNYFITEQHIADYCSNISSIYYLEDEEQYVLTIHLIGS